MAEAAVSFLLEKIEYVLTRECSLPENVKAEINRLKRELVMLRAVLKDADVQGEENNQSQTWIEELRDRAYQIEDVLDMFVYQIAIKNTPWYAGWSRIGNHSIATLIERIDTNFNSIREWREAYHNMFHSSFSSSDPDAATTGRIAPLYTSEVEIVGFDEPREELASWVLDVEKAYKVMFVVGIGGSGKTALVKVVYEQLKTDFDCHVWLTATKSVRSQQLLSTMFSVLCSQTSESSPSTSSQHDLINKLKNHLQDKRYLIVLDDLWIREVWESVKYALPKDNYSRVIITTRRGDIASSCRENSVDVYNLQALPFEKAQELFLTRAFPQSGMYPSAPGVRKLAEDLLKTCEGLPLGIIEIGKLISNREQTEFQLKTLHDSLQTELTSGQLSRIKQVLLLSYNDLPYHLKFCFLYMSLFPENYSVKRRMLIRLWIAEGFVKRESGKQLEDIGEEYLKELMERNLIKASILDFDGRPRTCQVHNLMLKIALWKSEAEKFFAVCTEAGGDISDKARRLSIQKGEFNMSNEIPPHARTLVASYLDVKTTPRISSSWKLLKILHLDGARVDTFPKGIKELLLLKYLCLSNTRIKRVPASIGRLQLLETLNLKQTFVTAMPDTLAKLEKLRHLLVRRYNNNCYMAFDMVQGFNLPTKIGNLTNLRKLSFVRADRDNKLIQQLQYLKELRKLGIIDLPSNSGPLLCEIIQMLSNLHSLDMTSLHEEEVLKIQEINNPPRLLQRLYLKGRLERMPHWISKLHDLVRIHLKWSRLTHEDNPIAVLGQLPHLLELQMLDAYTGGQLDFDVGQFLKLKILELEQMKQLQIIVVEKGALPCLEKLIICQCKKLRQIPKGIDNIQLKELHLSDLPSDFVDLLRRNGELRHLVQHIKKIYSKHLLNGPRWECEDLS